MEKTMSEIVFILKNKKEIATVDDKFVVRLVRDYIDRHKVNIHSPDFLRSAKWKSMYKEIRKTLNDVHGVFNKNGKADLNNLRKLVKGKLKINDDILDEHMKLLDIHLSTKERRTYYSEIYSKIFEIIGKPKNLIDAGCGLNPFSFVFMNLSEIDYYAFDINYSEVLNEYFEIMQKFGVNGKASILDLSDIYSWKDLPSCDVVLGFKLLDGLESVNRGITEEVMDVLMKKCRFCVFSFSLKSICGKRIYSSRRWFLKILRDFKLEHESFKVMNEMFYIVKF